MCGIAGFITQHAPEHASDILREMTDTLSPRGPDSFGTWIDTEHGVYLGHRRLSVVDLSHTGAQPQISQSGRYVMTYNGEVYNYRTLRDTLREVDFKGTSDTETMLACFDKYGIENSIAMFNGGFAFGVYDREEGQLVLARDRMGEKPLYYGKVGGCFVFASELRAFHKTPDFTKEIDRDSLALFFRYGYIPAPYSIYKNIFKLLPGHMLKYGNDEQVPYWSFLECAKPVVHTPEEAVAEVEQLLTNAISRQMLADVPLGAFLSGGIDSSLVVSIMQSLSPNPINTFTIGFKELGFDEAPFAKAIAERLGTNHTELYLTAKDACEVVPLLPKLYDEPFADSSQIPSYLVAKLARSKVSAVLTGDAGDEIFGGYNSYKVVMNSWNKLEKIPQGLKRFAGNAVLGIPSSAWDLLGSVTKGRLSGFKIHRGARSILMPSSFWDMCHEIRSVGDASLALGASMPKTIWDFPEFFSEFDMLGKMMTADTLMTLPYDMLVKVDKATGGCGLEARVPLLDIPLVEYAAGLPSELKIRGGQTKWILRQLLDKRIPREMTERPKSGFSVPIGEWLQDELRPWAENLLDPSRLRQDGYIDAERVLRMWRLHASRKADYTWSLWSVLMFQAWTDYWK